MEGMIFDDATCEMVFPPAPVVFQMPRVRDYIRVSDYALPAKPAITMAAISDAVTAYYRLEPLDLVSNRRMIVVTYPRQMAMYLARELTPRSLPEIGRAFGNRDHSTVIHAIRRVEYRLVHNADVKADYKAIVKGLRG